MILSPQAGRMAGHLIAVRCTPADVQRGIVAGGLLFCEET